MIDDHTPHPTLPDPARFDPQDLPPAFTPDQIKAARQALGLTQAGLAAALELANADSATVRSWENGRRAPSGPVRVAIRLMLEIKELRERLRRNRR